MHDPAEDWTRVTASTHPQVYAAFNLISDTSHEAYNVPHEYAHDLTRTENALSQLNEDERIKLCCGDFGPTITSDVVIASDTLSAFLHGWPVLFIKRYRNGGRS
jgi:hypothetical protein